MSKLKKKHKGKIVDGKIKFIDKDSFVSDIKLLEGMDVWFTIAVNRKPRSMSQNRYYWALLHLLETESEIGYTAEEWHEIFKNMFLNPKVVVIGAHELSLAGTTTQLNTKQMTEYIEKIRHFTNMEFSIYLPDASELGSNFSFN